MDCSFQPHLSILPEIEQLPSNDKKFIVMNKSILSSAAASDVTFIGPLASITYPLALELRERGECQQLRGEREQTAQTPEMLVIHHHRLTGRSIYTSEPYNGAAPSDQLHSRQVFVLRMEPWLCDERNGNAKEINKLTNNELSRDKWDGAGGRECH